MCHPGRRQSGARRDHEPPITVPSELTRGTVATMKQTRQIGYDVAFFIALMSTALALGAAAAHVLELPNKIGLPRDQYFVVQAIYAGWNHLAYLLAIQLLSIIAVIVISRHEPPVLWSTVAALLSLIAGQLTFWIYTYPANAMTDNWTVIPQNWEMLRRQWEYSHAAGAAFQTFAMGALILASILRAR
jgi:hypothetical protein